MSVMRVIVFHQCIPSLKFVGLPVPKIRLIFGDGVNWPGDLDPKLCHGSPVSWVSLLPNFSFIRGR